MTESTEPTGAAAWQVRRILLPTDFSGCANYALPYAAAIARAVNATVICVNVVEPIVPAVGYTGMAEAMPIAEMSEQMEDSAERELPDVMRCEDLRGLKVEEVIGHGDAAAEIVRVADEQGSRSNRDFIPRTYRPGAHYLWFNGRSCRAARALPRARSQTAAGRRGGGGPVSSEQQAASSFGNAA
jgi:hypothetical protein